MKRSILHLTKSEIDLLKQIISAKDSRLANLLPRLSSITLLLNLNHDLQINREEVEAIMDLLPAPSDEDSPSMLTLRQKLATSMSEMG